MYIIKTFLTLSTICGREYEFVCSKNIITSLAAETSHQSIGQPVSALTVLPKL
jgi:hypothetical protein